MPRNWPVLGRELKECRRARGLYQKEVGARLGTNMTERQLRYYEAGEKLPARDCLLRLLMMEYEVRTVAELNRFLQLATYSRLSANEIKQFALVEAETGQDGHDVPATRGIPSDFRIEVSTLIVVDGQGREVWRYQFPKRLEQSQYSGPHRSRRCLFADIDGDGGVETLFAYAPLDFASEGLSLICFSAVGAVKWEFVPSGKVKDSTGREYLPPYFISNVQVIPFKGDNPRILVSSSHHFDYLNQVAMLSSWGEKCGEYWHFGHLPLVAHAELRGDGTEYVLLGGVNNGYRAATLVVFNAFCIFGLSDQPEPALFTRPASWLGFERAVVNFPRTCVSKEAACNKVIGLRVTPQQRIVVEVLEGCSEARDPGVMTYEFDFRLKVLSARPNNHLEEAHRALELQGILDHSLTDKETARLKSQIAVRDIPSIDVKVQSILQDRREQYMRRIAQAQSG